MIAFLPTIKKRLKKRLDGKIFDGSSFRDLLGNDVTLMLYNTRIMLSVFFFLNFKNLFEQNDST